MKGYKVFRPDWTCRGFQYKVGETFKEDRAPFCCFNGFHFCTDLIDCFKYYDFNPENKVAEIEALGDLDFMTTSTGTKKYCTNKIKIIKELTWLEVLQMVNEGKGNSGLGNIGDSNSGRNNEGNYNSGEDNIGNFNSGNYNCGNVNSGCGNIGNLNSGNMNMGYRNSGDLNKTNSSSGCFNTVEDKILMFNKPTNWTMRNWNVSTAREVLYGLPNVAYKWVNYYEMTEQERKDNPNCYKENGYFARVEDSLIEENQAWWKALMPEYKAIIKQLPNFDAAIFEEITGIKVQ